MLLDLRFYLLLAALGFRRGGGGGRGTLLAGSRARRFATLLAGSGGLLLGLVRRVRRSARNLGRVLRNRETYGRDEEERFNQIEESV